MKDSKSIRDSSEIPAVYEEYKDELRGFISKRVDLKEDMEDILQNVFYSLVNLDLAENPIEHISAWLYRVTRNQITDYYRKKKEEALPIYDEEEDEQFLKDILNFLSDPEDSPETQFLRSLVWVELEKALEELPAEQRSVFELTELEGFSNKEISESIGIPVNTLLSRKRYAILHLRERLVGFYAELVGGN
ncbi:RNA polymerase sigma factor [Bacteroidales bacterium OttesenSCG-928-A17]|nr:RNA polymerase sigma factor [Bacteroidales bacterium OttesenSCG-928-A17]